MAEKSFPLAYLLTLTFYGNHLHGHSDGSVDLEHNQFGSPQLSANNALVAVANELRSEKIYRMDSPRREITLEAIHGVCGYRNWFLIAGHVRSTHCHIVVSAQAEPERVANDFKSYASRALNRCGLDGTRRKKRWTKGLSRYYLWNIDSVIAAARYTIFDQGRPMSVYPASEAELQVLLGNWLGLKPQPWDSDSSVT